MDRKKVFAAVEKCRGILKEHSLCDHCIGRMFAGDLGVKSHKRLGSNIRTKLKEKPAQTCLNCKNLMSTLDLQAKKMVQASTDYQFSTFLIGAILQPSIQDRDDSIRSKFRLRGITSIKGDVTRELGKMLSRKTKSVVDYHNPDVVFTIDFKKETCEIKPKALLMQGRYTKHMRDLPQKQKPCDQCDGKGCFACDFHGICEFHSVEGKLAKFFIETFGAQQVKITWIGSEDESSLVLGNGRPFFAKVINPRKRNIRCGKTVDLDGVSILGIKPINKIPSDPVRFRTVVVMEVETEKTITPMDLDYLERMTEKPVFLYENSRHHKKSIYSIRAKITSDNSFRVKMESDGGMPLKRLVSGQQVEPSISGLLETSCRCVQFDFEKIIVSK